MRYGCGARSLVVRGTYHVFFFTCYVDISSSWKKKINPQDSVSPVLTEIRRKTKNIVDCLKPDHNSLRKRVFTLITRNVIYINII